MTDQSIGKYKLIKKLATGGMAEVWLANQVGIEGFNRHIVVKRILPHLSEDPEFVQMFLNEAKIASRFNHPNIAQIYDLGQADGQYFIAMEFIHGEDLGRLMRKAWSSGQWIARPLAIRIIAEACKGLFYAHTKLDERGQPLKVVHRDISPQNILISFDGSVKLVDFGIAKAADQSSMTKSGAIKGKFAYMAPEQAGGKSLDARTDLFAMGLILYELLTGVRPLKRESEIGTLTAALECAIEPPSVVAEVPSELDEVVMRALAKVPDQRYRDASMFQMALEEFLIGQRLVATSVQISELMETLFSERRAEEQRLGMPNPSVQSESQQSVPVAAPAQEKKSAKPELTGTRDGKPDSTGQHRGAENDGEEPDHDGPVLPSRRYSTAGQTSMQRSQRDEPSEVTREKRVARDANEPSVGHTSVKGRSGRPRRSITDIPVQPNQTLDESDAESDSVPLPRSSGRRGTGVSRVSRLVRRNSSPRVPREETSHDEEPLEEPKKSKRISLRNDPGLQVASSSIEQAKQKQAQRWGGVIVALLLVAVAVMVFVYQRRNSGRGPQNGEVPIVLTVITQPPTKVSLRRGGLTSTQIISLGDTPLEDVKGAQVGDTVILTNEAHCIEHEEAIQFGQINEPRKIERTFGQGSVEVVTKPPIKGLGIYCNDQKVGVTGLRTLLYEGSHRLELRDDKLSQSVRFNVKVSAKKDQVARPPPIEIDAVLKK